MKFIFVADIHIKLGQKKVPKDWQANRLMLLAEELNKYKEDILIIGGDLLDVAKPSLEETGLMYNFLKKLEHPEIILIPGNHEMVSKKVDCFIHVSKMLEDLNVKVIRDFETYKGIDYIPYNILHDKAWPKAESSVAVTHVRGEIPPHVKPEVPLDRFKNYDKVFAGDLHSKKNTQANIYYPGSPYTTSFHRSIPTDTTGIIRINSDTCEHDWIELSLPSLVRKTISDASEAITTEYHHTVYEIEGNLADLSKVKNTELLDKKVTTDIVTPPTLNLSGGIEDELSTYFSKIHSIDSNGIKRLLSKFKETINDSD